MDSIQSFIFFTCRPKPPGTFVMKNGAATDSCPKVSQLYFHVLQSKDITCESHNYAQPRACGKLKFEFDEIRVFDGSTGDSIRQLMSHHPKPHCFVANEGLNKDLPLLLLAMYQAGGSFPIEDSYFLDMHTVFRNVMPLSEDNDFFTLDLYPQITLNNLRSPKATAHSSQYSQKLILNNSGDFDGYGLFNASNSNGVKNDNQPSTSGYGINELPNEDEIDTDDEETLSKQQQQYILKVTPVKKPVCDESIVMDLDEKVEYEMLTQLEKVEDEILSNTTSVSQSATPTKYRVESDYHNQLNTLSIRVNNLKLSSIYGNIFEGVYDEKDPAEEVKAVLKLFELFWFSTLRDKMSRCVISGGYILQNIQRAPRSYLKKYLPTDVTINI